MRKRLMALFLSAAIAASALLTGCGSAASGSTAASQEVVTFKMVGNNASALSTEAAKKIAALIEEKSNGTLKPELYLEGQLGDNVTPVAWGELFGALQTGIVNAQENPLANIDQAGLYQVRSYLMQTEHQYTNYFMFFNEAWWQSLSDEHKQIISEAIDEGFTWHNEQVNAEDEAFLESFQEKVMTLITKDEIDIESFKEAIIPQLLEENKDVYPESAYEQIQALNQ